MRSISDIGIVGDDPVKARKSAIMELFIESGTAKVEGVLDHLRVFLDNPMSGKVCVP